MTIKTEQISYNHLNYKQPSLYSNLFSLHCHNTYELLFFEKGEANYIIDEKKYKLHKNDLVFIRPYKYHYIEFTKDTEYSRINIAFSDTFVNKNLLQTIPLELEVVNCPAESIIAGLFGRMDYYTSKLTEESFIPLLSALLTEILYNIQIVDVDTVHIPSMLSPMLAEALEYINKNLFTVKEIREISNQLNVSEQYLFRLFHTQLHISPHKYLTMKRLLHAQSMLQQGNRPTDVYYRCGFDSYVGFYKQYLKMFGYPPSKEDSILQV